MLVRTIAVALALALPVVTACSGGAETPCGATTCKGDLYCVVTGGCGAMPPEGGTCPASYSCTATKPTGCIEERPRTYSCPAP